MEDKLQIVSILIKDTFNDYETQFKVKLKFNQG